MKVDNPFSREFLTRYPIEAARVLEQVAADDVTALLAELPPDTVVPVVTAMLPAYAVTCLVKMDPNSAAQLLAALPVSSAARIFQLLTTTQQDEVARYLSDKVRKRIYRLLQYAPLTAGDLMEVSVPMLPEELSVADALRRIERRRTTISCDIYIVNNTQQLAGVIELGQLMSASHHVKLREIMQSRMPRIFANTNADKVISNPGWLTHKQLPVVDRDNILLGVLDYTRVQTEMGMRAIGSHDPLDNVLSLASLYWLSLIQLLDSLLHSTPVSKGKRS